MEDSLGTNEQAAVERTDDDAVGKADAVGLGQEPAERVALERREHDGRTVIKEEQMPDGRRKLILKDERTGEFEDVVTEAAAPVEA